MSTTLPLNVFSAMAILLCSIALGVGMDALIKYLTQTDALLTLLAGRYLMGSLVAVCVFSFTTRFSSRSWISRLPDRVGLVYLGTLGFLHLCTASLFFYGISLLPLPTGTIIGFTSALMLPLIAWPVLGERPSYVALAAVVIGFIGALIAIQGPPTGNAGSSNPSQDFVLGTVSCLASALAYAFIVIIVRLRSAHENEVTINLFASLVPTLFLLLFLAFEGSVVDRLVDLFDRLLLESFALGSLGYITWFLAIVAYRKAEAQYLAPLEYTALIWSAIASAIVFQEPATWPIWLGGGIIIFACLSTSIQRRFINRRKTKMPSSKPFR